MHDDFLPHSEWTGDSASRSESTEIFFTELGGRIFDHETHERNVHMIAAARAMRTVESGQQLAREQVELLMGKEVENLLRHFSSARRPMPRSLHVEELLSDR